MRHVPKLGLLTMTVLSLAQIVCAAPVSYRLTTDGDKHRCEIFFEALKASRLAYMSDQQLCDVMNSPMESALHSKYIRNVDWHLAAVKSKERLAAIARNIIVSNMGGGHQTPRNEEYLNSDVSGPNGFVYGTDVVAGRAELKLGSNKYHLIQLRWKQCDTAYKDYETQLPIWGVLTGKDSASMVTNTTYLPGGNLFFIEGRLYAFRTGGWRTGFNYDHQKAYQTVSIISVDETIKDGNQKALAIGSECVVIIQNPDHR